MIINTKGSLQAALLRTTLESKDIVRQYVLRPYHATFTKFYQLLNKTQTCAYRY